MTHPIMTLLATGVPLTLLLDLQNPDGPDSQEIYLLEHLGQVPTAGALALSDSGRAGA
jgi:hypothetical protein